MVGVIHNNLVTRDGGNSVDVQKLLDKPWYKYSHLRRLYGWLIVVLLVQATNGLDGSIMNGMQTLPYWQRYFNYPTGNQLGIFNGTQGLGGAFTQLWLWWLVEKIGRRYTIIMGSVIIIIGVFLQSFAYGLAMFAVARVLIGAGLAFEYTAAPMLVTELAHPKHRAQLSTLLNTIYYFGATVAAWITLGTLTIKSDWSWRSVSLIQMFPSLISITLTWFVPESPRWLISKGRGSEAMHILRRDHCGGALDDPLADFEYHEIESALEFEKTSGTGGWLDLVRTKGNRHRTWIMVSCSILCQATGTTLVGYYLAVVLRGVGITVPRTQSIINGCLTMWNMAWAFYGACVIDKVGRRPMMIQSLTGMLFCGFIPWTICSAVFAKSGSHAAGNASIAFIFIYSAFYASTWNGILTGYTVESMSYDIRPKLICTQNLLVQAAITSFNYANPVALKNLEWRYYIIIDVIIALNLVVVYLTYPETRHVTLEEVAIIFDGDKAVHAAEAIDVADVGGHGVMEFRERQVGKKGDGSAEEVEFVE